MHKNFLPPEQVISMSAPLKTLQSKGPPRKSATARATEDLQQSRDTGGILQTETSRPVNTSDNQRQDQGHKQQKPIYAAPSEPRYPTTASSGYPNTPETRTLN